MKTHRETGDDRDNRRVFVWGACAAVLILVVALIFLYAVDKRGEAPVQAPANTPQSAPPSAPPATSGAASPR